MNCWKWSRLTWEHRSQGATKIKDSASTSRLFSMSPLWALTGKTGGRVGDLRQQTWRKEQLPEQERHKSLLSYGAKALSSWRWATTLTPTGPRERVRKKHLYLWSGGTPGPRMLPQYHKRSPTAGGGQKVLFHTRLTKDTRRSLAVTGRRDSITEKTPKLRHRTWSLPKTEGESGQQRYPPPTHTHTCHHQGSKPEVTSNSCLLLDGGKEHWKRASLRYRCIRDAEKRG